MPRTKKAFEEMRETTRQKIEAAALSLFAKKGISVTVGEIAQAAGLSNGLLYSHYKSKDAQIAGLVGQAITFSNEKMSSIVKSNDSAVVKIGNITSMMCETLSSRIGNDYLMFMLQADMSGFPIQKIQADYYDTGDFLNPIESLAQIISIGQSENSIVDGEPAQLAITYWATIQGLCCFAVTGISLLPDPKIILRILLK